LAYLKVEKIEISGFSLTSLQISIKGIVQGVGFRPYVYSLAEKYKIDGKVWNTSSGVEIQVSGPTDAIAQFLDELRDNPPILARIDQLKSSSIDTVFPPGFEILKSQSNADDFLLISPDNSVCKDCRSELFDPQDRRFRYPFINCTNCGPRLTIITEIPYDRPNTTMAGFELCPECMEEYNNPADRRFHAQPIACRRCGPNLTFQLSNGQTHYKEDALVKARESLKNGRIIAIKGLGGYHIACDASNQNVVEQLISRKHRSDKPLALMAFNESVIEKLCEVSPSESQLLNSTQHPIVLLKMKKDCKLPENIAPNQNHLGFMLPYTPLHLLLLEPEPEFPEVLVMTSGNISEEPIAYDDEDAFNRLSPLVDGFLTHNRGIHTRVDDSVYRIYEYSPYPIRRSRGYAPNPIVLPAKIPEILACGAELKNTFTLSRENYAFISHHIGDLENYETLRAFETGIEHFQRLFRIKPKFIASDLHPDYLSSTYAIKRSENEDLPLIKVQHHHAHLSSCLVDNHWDSNESVIGIIFDGTGFGSDGSIWGGEFLLGNYAGFSRPFHLASIPLPGGDSSIRQPAKIGLSYLAYAGIALEDDLPPVAHYSSEDLNLLQSQISHEINSPLTSSMGRLFDAVSSIIGIRQSVSYEAQAAIDLENFCDWSEKGIYTYSFEGGVINTSFIINEIVEDWRRKENKGIISAKFHNTIARLCLEVSLDTRKNSGVTTVALSGGVWQNITLLQKTKPLLEENGFSVLIHHQVPSNDGGISLGQLMVASTAQFR
jgi:hydrogenase maturation protein HypF